MGLDRGSAGFKNYIKLFTLLGKDDTLVDTRCNQPDHLKTVLQSCLNSKRPRPARSTVDLYNRLLVSYFKECYGTAIAKKGFLKVSSAQTTK